MLCYTTLTILEYNILQCLLPAEAAADVQVLAAPQRIALRQWLGGNTTNYY